jgi:hypothetical protein
MKIIMYSDITRPRISGSTDICTNAFAEVIVVSAATPQIGSTSANVRYDGIRPATISVMPKTTAAMMTSRCRDTVRRAASSEPTSEPTAMIDPSMPYSPAPLS